MVIAAGPLEIDCGKRALIGFFKRATGLFRDSQRRVCVLPSALGAKGRA